MNKTIHVLTLTHKLGPSKGRSGIHSVGHDRKMLEQLAQILSDREISYEVKSYLPAETDEMLKNLISANLKKVQAEI